MDDVQVIILADGGALVGAAGGEWKREYLLSSPYKEYREMFSGEGGD